MSVGTWWAVFIQPPAVTTMPMGPGRAQELINDRRRKLGLPPAKPRAESRG